MQGNPDPTAGVHVRRGCVYGRMATAVKNGPDKKPLEWAQVTEMLAYLDLPDTPKKLERPARAELADALQQLAGLTPQQAAKSVGLEKVSRNRTDSSWWTDLVRPVESLLLVAVMFGLVGIAVAIFLDALVGLLRIQGLTFGTEISSLLDDALLMFIVLEIVETVRQQVASRERLYPNLVRNFLASRTPRPC